MNTFRFSPIQNTAQLFAAIEYIHTQCHEACREVMGRYLPVAGNIGVFCHDEAEFVRLTHMREELTDSFVHWNHKYFRLHTPVTIEANNDIPPATYTYVYIRKPDEAHPQVGDVDFYLPQDEYVRIKARVLKGDGPVGLSVFERPDLDLLVIDPGDRDIVAFIGSYSLDSVVNKIST